MNTTSASKVTASPEPLLLECERLIAVPGPAGSRHHILIRPAEQTVKSIREWQASGEARSITVEAFDGRWPRDVKARVIEVKPQADVWIVTTDR